MRVVLDTNVIVAALLSAFGPPAHLLNMVLDGHLQLVVSPSIVAEYHEVLQRARFHFDELLVTQLLFTLESIALHTSPLPWPITLPDADDETFIATAHAGLALLITGNERHFPFQCRNGVIVMTPRQAYDYLREQLTPSLHENLPPDYFY